MSDTQSITYNTGLNAVAVDSIGNLVTDSAGNLIIPVAPIGITVYSEGNHSDCRCAIVRIESSAGEQTFIPCRNSMPFRQNSELWLATSSDIHEVHVGSNFGNLTTQSAEFSINAGIIIDRPPGEFAATEVSVQISWGNQHIQSDNYYVCHQGMRTYFLGSISVDLNRLTLTYTPPNLPTDRGSVKCEQKEEPPEPEIIVIDAPYSWCGRVYSVDAESNETVTEGATLYTESGVPSTNDLVWASDRTEIKVDEGATDDEREEAITNASVGRITSVQKREYMLVDPTNTSLQLAHNTFWRDNRGDTSTDNWTTITVYSCTGSVTGKHLWVEQRPGASGATTKRIWSASSEFDEVSDDVKETYEVSKNLVEKKDLPWVTQTSTDVIVYAHVYESVDDMIYDGIVEDAHITTDDTCGSYGRWAQLSGMFKPDDPSCPYGGMDLYSAVVLIGDDWNGSYEDLWRYFLTEPIPIAPGYASCVDGDIVYVETPSSIKGGMLHVDPSDEGVTDGGYFVYDNEQYQPNGAVGYVFEKDTVPYLAWTVSPCYENKPGVTTLYTKKDGDPRLFIVNAGVITETSIGIVSSGTSVYSFKVGEGDGTFSTIHYWTDSMETNIDEEFE